MSAKAARIGRCVGLVFDPEPYGDNPWAYESGKRPDLCGSRGAGPQAWGGVHHGHTVGNARGAGADLFPPEFSSIGCWRFRISRNAGPSLRSSAGACSARSGTAYSKRPHRAYASSTATNRRTTSPRASGTSVPTTRCAGVHSPGCRRSFTTNTPSSSKSAWPFIWINCLGLRQPTEKYISTYLTPEERLKWWEHNVYYALYTTDEYVSVL